jgi:hypothetical protein
MEVEFNSFVRHSDRDRADFDLPGNCADRGVPENCQLVSQLSIASIEIDVSIQATTFISHQFFFPVLQVFSVKTRNSTNKRSFAPLHGLLAFFSAYS